LLIGSHLDTVPDAGAFDGVLGVVIGLALVECFRGERLPFAIEVIGFSEEEGVRFGVPFIGSRALAGTLDENNLSIKDRAGVSVGQAICEFGLDTAELNQAALTGSAGAYLEFHIEQGPVLESIPSPLGVVTGIVGQSRTIVTFGGKASHAGTTPMAVRQDALCGAAEWITCVETQGRATDGLVATIGSIEALPGAPNVVPGEVSVTLDIRHLCDDIRREANSRLLEAARNIARMRRLEVELKMLAEQDAVQMNDILTGMAEQAIRTTGIAPYKMVSGAGHDAMILAPELPSAMIFLRSPGGISHHPDERVTEEDVAAALGSGVQLLKDLCTCHLLT
jgi:allantoate deiminase